MAKRIGFSILASLAFACCPLASAYGVEEPNSARCQMLRALLRTVASEGTRDEIFNRCHAERPEEPEYCSDYADRVSDPANRAQAVFDLERQCYAEGCALD